MKRKVSVTEESLIQSPKTSWHDSGGSGGFVNSSINSLRVNLVRSEHECVLNHQYLNKEDCKI